MTSLAPPAARKRRSPFATTLQKSAISFAQEAVTWQNAPNVANRHEKVAILLLTAWEKLLKAYLHKHDAARGIYYKPSPLPANQCVSACPYYAARAQKLKRGQPKPPPKTITFDDCLTRVHALLGTVFTHPREMLLQASAYRDTCVHAAVDELDAIALPILTQCVLDFAAFLKAHFHKELFAELHLAILPVGYSRPFTATDFLTSYNSVQTVSPEIKHFLQGITEAGQRLHAAGLTEGLLVEYHLHLLQAKNPAKADNTVRVDNNATNVPTIRVERPVEGDIKLTDRPNASVVRLPDGTDALMQLGFTLRYDNMTDLVKREGYKQNPATLAIIQGFKLDPHLAQERLLEPGNPQSQSKWFYHTTAQTKLAEYLALHGVARIP